MTVILDESSIPITNEKIFYPQRKRCRKCRKYLAWVVIDRLFCSYECADVTPPSNNPMDWPRKHWRIGENGRVEKRYFSSPDDVGHQNHRGKKEMNVYYCDYCHTFHLGRKSLN